MRTPGRIRGAAALASVPLVLALLAVLGPSAAAAHSGLARADPAPGAALASPPSTVRLTFTEPPEPSLSVVEVLDSGGGALEGGPPQRAGGDPLTLIAPLEVLPRGTYTVNWRVVSAVDGHATSGSYAFGVGVSPQDGASLISSGTPTSSALEVVARWVLLVGLVVLIGASGAAIGRFGGQGRTELALAGAGWAGSIVGLALLVAAQRQTAGTSLADLLDTSVGSALIWRALALGGAGLALAVAWWRPALQRPALALAGIAAIAAVAAHVGAGHAASGPWPDSLTVTVQVAHLLAAGVWFGGLAALLAGTRGEASEEKAAAVRRFGVAAAAALGLVVITGTLRAVDELSSFGELLSSGYGRAILAKVLLIALIVWIAARSRRDAVPAAGRTLGPLRRNSAAELTLALLALAAAALLGTLAPPVRGEAQASPGLSASGEDFATTVRAELRTASDRPGPNRFELALSDFDSGEPVDGAQVGLRFTPLDDPGTAPTTLALRPGPGGTYAGAGANLAFDGRWGVVASVRRGTGVSEVPMELDVPGPKHFVSVERVPGRPPKYTMQIGSIGYIRIEPDPERAGPSTVYVTCFTAFQAVSKVTELVLTAASPGRPARQQPVRRLGFGRFAAPVDLAAGPNEIAVVARTPDGTRLRGEFRISVPAG